MSPGGFDWVATAINAIEDRVKRGLLSEVNTKAGLPLAVRNDCDTVAFLYSRRICRYDLSLIRNVPYRLPRPKSYRSRNS
jgi:hypothetical protein